MVHIKLVHSSLHARGGVGGAAVLAEELLVVVLRRVLLGAWELMQGSRTGQDVRGMCKE